MRAEGHTVDVVFRRRDGSLSAEWDPSTVALVARCRCSPAEGPARTWTGNDHPVSEAGASAACAEWDRRHVAPLLAGIGDATAPTPVAPPAALR